MTPIDNTNLIEIIDTIGVGACVIISFLMLLLLLETIFRYRRPYREPPTSLHRGLEMKANKGRLVYVRETESERPL